MDFRLVYVPNWFIPGCPLSVVHFLIVFNLLLDLLKTKQDHGYQLKNTDLKHSQKAYADDLTMIAEVLVAAKNNFDKRQREDVLPSACKSPVVLYGSNNYIE